MKNDPSRIDCRSVIAIAIIMTLITLISCNRHNDTEQIAMLLERDTPLGSTEREVIAHLDKEGIRYYEPWRGRVDTSLSYPPNTVPGNSFIRAIVSEYGIVFISSVEAFYIFGENKRLVEVVVRITKDAL